MDRTKASKWSGSPLCLHRAPSVLQRFPGVSLELRAKRSNNGTIIMTSDASHARTGVSNLTEGLLKKKIRPV